MANTAKLFGAALLNALGKGVEGYGQGTKDYRDYALEQLTKKIQAERARPSIQRDVEAYMQMSPSEQAAARDLRKPYYGPQPPAQVQVASDVAAIRAKKPEQRTKKEQEKLNWYESQGKQGIGEKPDFSKL